MSVKNGVMKISVNNFSSNKPVTTINPPQLQLLFTRMKEFSWIKTPGAGMDSENSSSAPLNLKQWCTKPPVGTFIERRFKQPFRFSYLEHVCPLFSGNTSFPRSSVSLLAVNPSRPGDELFMFYTTRSCAVLGWDVAVVLMGKRFSGNIGELLMLSIGGGWAAVGKWNSMCGLFWWCWTTLEH